MTALSEICIAFIFNFTIFIGYYDKIEEFNNTEQREMYGYLIIFSILGKLFWNVVFLWLGALIFGLLSLAYDLVLYILKLIRIVRILI